jgi:peptide/nickel transport system substrate-binding protein
MAADAIQAQLGLPAVRIREGQDPREFDVLPGTQWIPRFGWEVLDFNLDNLHLADLQVRQAIAHAIDRQAIIAQTLAGHGTLMQSYLPAWHPLYAGDENLPDYSFDPTRARELLQAAGYDLSQFPATHPTRGPLVLQLASMDVAAYPRQGTAALIQEFLADVGIQVEISFYGYTEFEGQDCTAIRNGRQFDLGLAGWLGGTRYYLWWVEHVTLSNSIPTAANGCPLDKANWTGWQNPRVDEIVPLLFDGRLALEEPGTYFALWVEHQQLWATELPSIPLFNVQRPIVVAQNLQGPAVGPFAFEAGVQDTWNIFAWELK